MKIAFYGIEGWEEPILKEKLQGHELKFSKEIITPENSGEIQDFDCISTFINNPVNKELLDKLPNLKLITTRSTGFDHIDIETCNRFLMFA